MIVGRGRSVEVAGYFALAAELVEHRSEFTA